MEKIERQEQPITDNAKATTEQENQSHIDSLVTDLEESLKPGNGMLITDLTRQDTDFQRSVRHSIRLKSIQSTYMFLDNSINLTNRLLELERQKANTYQQELQEKATYLLNVTEQSTSLPSTDSTKPKPNTKTSNNTLESQSPTTLSKKSSESMPSQTTKS